MAWQDVGTRIADWTTRPTLRWPALTIGQNDVHLFSLQPVVATEVSTGGYLNLFAQFTTTQGLMETPLLYKYYPVTVQMGFSLSYPRSRLGATSVFQIVGRPKELQRGTQTPQQIELLLRWDDQPVQNPIGTNVFGGSA